MMPRRSNLSRRQFLARGTAAGASLFAAPAFLRGQNLNSQLQLGFIAAGGRGGGDLKTMTDQKLVPVNVAALVDVNQQNLYTALKLFPKAQSFSDFRRMYDEVKDLDAVCVATTEHTHAFAMMPAIKLGKHIYCEKPLTRDVQECRVVTEAALANPKLKTQMGTQNHGLTNYRRVTEKIWSGAIGPVRECHVWVDRAWGLQSKEDYDKYEPAGKTYYAADRPKEGMTPPDFLDWDLWVGPAPYRPYHECYFPGPRWYRWWDFANGTMSDLGSHWNDLAFWALRLDAPKTVEAFGPPVHPEIAPASMHAVYEYGERTGYGPLEGSSSIGNPPASVMKTMPACKVHWYQGQDKPPQWKDGTIPNPQKWPNGHLFIGDKGMLLSDYKGHVLLPEKNFEGYEAPEPFIPDVPGQHEEWLLAIANDGQTGSPFRYAGALTEANHLGGVAYRTGEKIVWDAKAMKVTNVARANEFIQREPRKPWTLNV